MRRNSDTESERGERETIERGRDRDSMRRSSDTESERGEREPQTQREEME